MALSEEISESMAETLIAFRQETPFTGTAGVRSVAGFDLIGFDSDDKGVDLDCLFSRVSDAPRLAIINSNTRFFMAVNISSSEGKGESKAGRRGIGTSSIR